MPYIEQKDQDKFELFDLLRSINQNGITPGELNFLVTTIALAYVQRKGLDYTHINDVLGALEGAKQEFYRRIATPYEEHKRITNGDVFPTILLQYDTKEK